MTFVVRFYGTGTPTGGGASSVARSDADGIWDTTGANPSETFTLSGCTSPTYIWQVRVDPANPSDPDAAAPTGWQTVAGETNSTFTMTGQSASTLIASIPGFDTATMTGGLDLDLTLKYYVRGSCDGGTSWSPEEMITIVYDFTDSL